MRLSIINILIAALFTVFSAPASAATMIYTATGAANGFTDSGAFANPFIVTAMADPSTKQQCMGPGGPIANCNFVVNSSLTIDVAGFGSFVVSTPTITTLNTATNIFSFTQLNFGGPTPTRALMVVNIPVPGLATNPGFALWDIVSSFGPLTTTSLVQRTLVPPTFSTHIPIATDAGDFFVTQSPAVVSTFTATRIENAVPEPSTWMMLIAGFGLIGLVLRRRAHLAFS